MFKHLAWAATLLAASASVLADQISVFDAQGTFADGAVMGGTMTIDVTSGVLESANLTLTSPDAGTYSTIQETGYSSVSNDYLTFVGQSSDETTNSLHLALITTSLVGFAGGTFDSDDEKSSENYLSDLRNSSGTIIDLTQGTLTPVPLPASAWLMLSAIGGLMIFRRARGAAY
jgi:hypothetical protein